METVQEFGIAWDVKTPRSDIRWLVNKMNVSVTLESVARRIKRRCKGPGFTPEIIQQSMDYAKLLHSENIKTYRQVMSGTFR